MDKFMQTNTLVVRQCYTSKGFIQPPKQGVYSGAESLAVVGGNGAARQLAVT